MSRIGPSAHVLVGAVVTIVYGERLTKMAYRSVWTARKMDALNSAIVNGGLCTEYGLQFWLARMALGDSGTYETTREWRDELGDAE
jgi:hypothetical protein